MSGVAGGNRIIRKDVQPTYDKYEQEVLQRIPSYIKSTLTGSSKLQTKPDYGDIDLIALFKGNDKKQVKKDIINVVSKMSDSVIVPFKSEKYKGKKYYNSGEMISILYPIEGKPGEFIQVDNIIALSEQEQGFKNSFLDLPAEKQGLILGLIKVATLEEEPQVLFKRLGILNVESLGENEEYEFNLSSAKLTLRKVKLENFKEVGRKVLWETTDWTAVDKLLERYDLNKDFEELLREVGTKLKNPRSKRRVKGIFKSMVSVKSGEVGTPKGDNKEKALKAVDTLLESKSQRTVGVYGGGFKPPHKAHFNNALTLAKNCDELVIFIGPKLREGFTISSEQSKKVWEIYVKHLPIPVDVRLSEKSPIKDIYDFVDQHKHRYSQIITGTLPEERKRFAYFEKNKDKYPNVSLLNFEKTVGDEDKKLSATNIRRSTEYFEKSTWMPEILSHQEKQQILNILKPSIEELMKEALDNIFKTYTNLPEKLSEGSGGTPIDAVAAIPSKDRAKMEEYLEYYQNLTPKGWNVSMKGMQIIIAMDKYSQGPQSYNNDYDNTPNQPSMDVSEEVGSFDFIPYISSIIEHMLDQGMNILPLPDIKLRKDQAEAADIFGKTAYYNPTGREVILFTLNRHPKDVLRSFCHEMIHHIQNIEDRLGNITTTNTQEDDHLAKIEQEAHYLGSITFRHWEDKVKQQMDSAEKAPLQEDTN